MILRVFVLKEDFVSSPRRHEDAKIHHVLAYVNLRVFVSLW